MTFLPCLVEGRKIRLNRKKKLWCQIEKKIKNGTVESKRGCQIEKQKKKLQTAKRGVKQQK